MTRWPFSVRIGVLVGIQISVVLSLCACGGGGSGGGGAPPAPVANQSPTASFTATPTSGGAPLEVIFNGLTSSDPDGTIATFSWDFGDPNDTDDVAVGATARHTYTQPGNYTAQLTVTDNRSAAGTRTGTVTVNAPAGSFTLSGRVRILPSSAIDSDVNDTSTLSAFVRNDTFDTAQPLPNPVTLGGYVKLPGTGTTGRVPAGGDVRDTFSVSLTGNETIILTIGDATDADLDLLLYDNPPLPAAPVLRDASTGALGTGTETLQTATLPPGDYFIQVLAVTGASNYVLNVGQTPLPAAYPPRLSEDFVPGELLIGGAEEPPARHALQTLAVSENLRRVRLPSQSFANARTEARRFTASASNVDKLATLSMLKVLARDPDIAYAEPNYIRRAAANPNDSFFGFQWHYPSISLPVAWDLIANGSLPNGDNTIVAVVDTGVLLNHPDLAAQILRSASNQVIGYDFISDPTRANDGNGIDPDPDDPGDKSFGTSGSFHGTHVAGTIAARTNNALGVAGIAWNAKLMPMRALGVGGGTSFDVIQAVRWAAGLSNTSNTLPPRRADVINLSLGGGGSSISEQDTYTLVRNAGVIVVASAGNDASALPSYPAGYSGVLSVSATTINKTQASYSNRGSTIDLAAPGGNNATDVNGDGLGDGVVSTIGDNSSGTVQFGYAALNGTSMASPHVAGVIALMKGIFQPLTPAQLETALFDGRLTDDLGAQGRDDLFGHGLINAQKAVLVATELQNGAGAPTSPVLTTSPTSLNFGAFDETLTLEIKNAGGGSLDVTPAVPVEPWLTIEPLDPVTLDVGESATVQIRVDRTGLVDGTYSAQALFDSSANDVALPVVMQVTSLDIDANAGVHYVILIDASTGSSVPGKIDEVAATNGEYPYVFTGVASGQYRIAAGTDSDNDNFLCDGGEACGLYRTLDSPDTLSINASRTGLDFTSGFRVNLFNQNGAGFLNQNGAAALNQNGAAALNQNGAAALNQNGAAAATLPDSGIPIDKPAGDSP